MTRRSIFAWLFGGAAAGQEPDFGNTFIVTLAPAWKTGPALNGQCPVCGTMAEAYRRPTHRVGERDHESGTVLLPDGTGISDLVLHYYQKDTVYGPMTNNVACATCNNVFQQRAEEGKP